MIAAVVTAFVAAAVIAAALAPATGRWASRLACVAPPNPDVPTHVHVIPLGGGVAIVAGMSPALLLACAHEPRWLGLAAALAIVGALGAYKDRVQRPVSPLAQLAVQATAGAMLAVSGVRTGIGSGLVDGASVIALVLLLVNAWNFLDVMDGLVGGTTAIAMLCYVTLGVAGGDASPALVAAGLGGGALGFLRTNFPPARQYMGDVGSFSIGVTTAALACAAGEHAASGRRAAVLLPLFVPLADFVFTTGSRLLAGRSPFIGGPEHAPLRLAARGWPRTRVLALAYTVSAAAGLATWLIAS